MTATATINFMTGGRVLQNGDQWPGGQRRGTIAKLHDDGTATVNWEGKNPYPYTYRLRPCQEIVRLADIEKVVWA